MDTGVGFVELIQERNQKISADGVAGSDAQLAAAQFSRFHQLVFAAFDQVHGGFNVAKQGFSFRRQLYPFGASDKKIDAQLFLQCFDGLADGRL